MNTISCDNLYHLNRFKILPPDASYIAGFIDGDGCIFIRKIKNGYNTGINISQCRTNILQIMKYHFGGTITTCKKRCNNKDIIINGELSKTTIRNEYNYNVRSNEYNLLLDYLKDKLIIKNKQYEYLCEINKYVNLPINYINEKNICYKNCSLLNKIKENNNLEYDLNKLNIQYIAGLFDSEGCVNINKKYFSVTLSISQKNNNKILFYIQQFLGYGKLNKYNLTIQKNNCIDFINKIKNFLIVKYNQICYAENILNETNFEIKKQNYLLCNKEKHENEYYENLNKTNFGKEGFVYINNIKKIKENICKEIKSNNFYKKKSENMMGENNHNFGKKFSQETRKKMSISIRKSKGKINDEIIISVNKMIEDGFKNIDIEKNLNLSRDIVTKIKNKKIVRDNEIFVYNAKSQEENNILKRKISLDCILKITDKILENKSPNNILIELKSEKGITIDIIKNIKRNIFKNKIPFYEVEVGKNKFEEYKIKINNLIKTI